MKAYSSAALPARSLEDLHIDSEALKPDLDLGARYLDFCRELTRLALLGVGVYGFFLKEVVMKDQEALRTLASLHRLPALVGLGMALLAIAAAAGFWTSQVSTNCLKLQVDILRYIKRRTNSGWSAEERLLNDTRLEEMRVQQRSGIRYAWWTLRIATFSLISATLLLGFDMAYAS